MRTICRFWLTGNDVNSSFNPFSTAVPIWGQTSLIPSDLSPKRDWGPKRVKHDYRNFYCTSSSLLKNRPCRSASRPSPPENPIHIRLFRNCNSRLSVAASQAGAPPLRPRPGAVVVSIDDRPVSHLKVSAVRAMLDKLASKSPSKSRDSGSGGSRGGGGGSGSGGRNTVSAHSTPTVTSMPPPLRVPSGRRGGDNSSGGGAARGGG